MEPCMKYTQIQKVWKSNGDGQKDNTPDEVRFNDGKFEVVLIRKVRTPFQIFSLLIKMRRHEYDGETLVHFQASTLRFIFEKPENWTLDGECSGPVDQVQIDVKNNAVRIFCPDSEYFV